MSENQIKVTATTNKPLRVNVTAPDTQGNVTLSPDTSAYNAGLAEQWAISDKLVMGKDYSSKYYANQAKENALSVENFAEDVSSIYNSFTEISDQAINELNITRDEAIANIETSRVEAVDSINSTKTTILSDIEFVADGEKKEIEDLIDSGKDEIQELTNEVKDNAEDIINRLGISMFDTILKDHVLTYEESKGLALQGTYVYKDAIAGSRYGYPDFYAKCLEERNTATAIEVTLGGSTITMYINSNGHQFFDIAEKDIIDAFFDATGMAWMYGIDQENERIFLPRNVWFEQMSIDEVGKAVEAGLPNITGIWSNYQNGWGKGSKDYCSYSGALYNAGSNGLKASSGDSASYGYKIGFNASKSNAIYGKSNTVQPNAVKKLLYICVGNTVSDTSWVDVVTQVENGVKDLDDKTNEGLDKLSNASNALRQTQITNCLLEVPQRIKYELNEGTLTIKAGSVVIVPYGIEDLTAQYPVGATFLHENFKVYDTQFADGKFFVWAELVNDVSVLGETTDTSTRIMYLDISSPWIRALLTGLSGSEDYSETGKCVYYQTTKNMVQRYTDGALQEDLVCSLPIGICVANAVYTFGSIDQIFNGMGYIGSTIWVDKGVKGLIPNGRNEDGTLNNIGFVTDKLLINATFNTNANVVEARLVYNGSDITLTRNTPSNANFYFDYKNNYYHRPDGTQKMSTDVVTTSTTTDGIQTFGLKLPFRAVDYSQVDGQWVSKELIATEATAIGEYTLDLSDYLPNDGYMYEVWGKAYLSRGDTSGTNTNVHIFDGFGERRSIAHTMADGSNFQQNSTTFLLTVDTQRTMGLSISGVNASVFNIYLQKYRRLGTNQ